MSLTHNDLFLVYLRIFNAFCSRSILKTRSKKQKPMLTTKWAIMSFTHNDQFLGYPRLLPAFVHALL